MIALMSRVVTIRNRKSSMRLTDVEWRILEQICLQEKTKRKNLLEMIEDNCSRGFSYTSSVRLFMLIYLYNKQYKQKNGVSCLQKTLTTLQ